MTPTSATLSSGNARSSEPTPASVLLRNAAASIDHVGLFQPSKLAFDGDCIITALRPVSGPPEARAALHAVQRRLGVQTSYAVTEWNDAQESAADVTSLLRSVADELELQERSNDHTTRKGSHEFEPEGK